MNMLVWAVALVAAVAVEAALPASWLLGRTRAPVLLGVVAYYALNRSRGLMLAAALAGGLLRDAVTGLPLGCSAVGLALVGGSIRAHRELIFGRRLTTRLALGLASGAAFSLATYLAVLAAVGPDLAVSVPEALAKAAGEGVWCLAALPAALAVLDGLERMVGNVGAAGAHDFG